jgi:hypothetical protein
MEKQTAQKINTFLGLKSTTSSIQRMLFHRRVFAPQVNKVFLQTRSLCALYNQRAHSRAAVAAAGCHICIMHV